MIARWLVRRVAQCVAVSTLWPLASGCSACGQQASEGAGDAAPDADQAGKVTEETLTRVVLSHGDSIEDCIRSYASGAPAEPVTLDLIMTLGGEGAVVSTHLAPQSLESSEAGRCLLRIAWAMRFPAPGRTLRFSIPLTVTAGGDAAIDPPSPASPPRSPRPSPGSGSI